MWRSILLLNFAFLTRAEDDWRIKLHENGRRKVPIPTKGVARVTPIYQGMFQSPMNVNPDSLLLRAINIPAILGASQKQLETASSTLPKYQNYFGKVLSNVEEVLQGKRGLNILPASSDATNLNDVICNPELQDCETASDVARVFGDVVRNMITKSALYKTVDRGLSYGKNVYDIAKSPLTDTLIDTLEMEPLVQTIEESVLDLSSPLTILKPMDQNVYTHSIKTMADNTLFEPLERFGASSKRIDETFDRASEMVLDVLRDSPGEAENGFIGISPQAAARSSVLNVEEKVQKFVTYNPADFRIMPSLYLKGFIESCNVFSGCFANGKSLFPQLFDGFYRLHDADAEGFLVYKRMWIDEVDSDLVKKYRSIYNIPKEDSLDTYLWMDHDNVYITIGEYGHVFEQNAMNHRFVPHAKLYREKNKAKARLELPSLYDELNAPTAHWILQTGDVS